MSDQRLVRIVDDDNDVRESLKKLVEAMGYAVACYESAEEFLAGNDGTVPGCIVLDVKMPGMSGIELQQYLTAKDENVPVILISAHGDIPMCVEAMKMGAVDFLEKPFRTRALEECICKALDLDEKRRRESQARADIERKLRSLTSQERAVLDGIAGGKQTKQIAAELDVSLRTVQFRRASLMEKLEVDSRAELVKLITQVTDAPSGSQICGRYRRDGTLTHV